MLEPNQIEVNEAWIAFRINSAPIRTEQDGDFDFIVLMDAASCFILGSELFPFGMRSSYWFLGGSSVRGVCR